MSTRIRNYPAFWLKRHRTGGIDDHPQRYHINVGKRYGMGNFRQISPHYGERRFNNPPVKSNWSYFAEKWNMGVADLDDFARYMGYRDFDEMESRVSPWELYNRSKVKFKYALRKTSDKGHQYFREQPKEVVEHEIEETASVSGWLDNQYEEWISDVEFKQKVDFYGDPESLLRKLKKEGRLFVGHQEYVCRKGRSGEYKIYCVYGDLRGREIGYEIYKDGTYEGFTENFEEAKEHADEVGGVIKLSTDRRKVIYKSGNLSSKFNSGQKIKEPWEMTRDEYTTKELEREATMRGIMNPWEKEIFFQNKKNDEYYERIHRRYIEKALKEGKSVPSEVLKEYPDLKKKYISKSKKNDKGSLKYSIKKYGYYGDYVIRKDGVTLKEDKGFYIGAKEFPTKEDAKNFIEKLKNGKYVVGDRGLIQKNFLGDKK